MILTMMRALFVLLMAAVGYSFVKADPAQLGIFEGRNWLMLGFALVLGVLVIAADILSGREKLRVFSGVFFGLVVGLTIAYALSFAVVLIVDQLLPNSVGSRANNAIANFLNLLLGTICCYLAVSFILQTKDDFRFVIPYVEFRRQMKGSRPLLLDTSALIDGRIRELAATGVIDAQLIVPRPVQVELQRIADGADRAMRTRGRRGLDILADLKRAGRPEVVDYAPVERADLDVDQLLIELAGELGARLMTTDVNLAKLAGLRGIETVNLNDIASAVRPSVLPGERLRVRITKPGEDSGQGVGYLDDGTMVVVEHARSKVNADVDLIVTNVRQTQMGRMVFGRLVEAPAPTAPANVS